MSIRIFQDSPLAVHAEIILSSKASHHLLHVLRVKVGDDIILFNGYGGEYAARIQQINKKNVVVLVGAFNDKVNESHVEIILGQGIARQDKMDFIVQKSVELGVTRIVPLITSRATIRKISAERLAHWRQVLVSACEQCGRNRLPEITMPMDFFAWCEDDALAGNCDERFILSPEYTSELKLKSNKAAKRIAILVGPEGGFAASEIQFALQNGFRVLQLGPRVLRTETAAIAALAVMQFHFGDL